MHRKEKKKEEDRNNYLESTGPHMGGSGLGQSAECVMRVNPR